MPLRGYASAWRAQMPKQRKGQRCRQGREGERELKCNRNVKTKTKKRIDFQVLRVCQKDGL